LKLPTFLKSKAERQEADAKKRKDALERLKELSDTPPSPYNPPVVPVGAPLVDMGLPSRIAIEIVDIKEGKKVTLALGAVSPKASPLNAGKDIFFFYWKRFAYYLDFSKVVDVTEKESKIASFAGGKNKPAIKKKLVFHVLYSEPLNQDGSISWSYELESILTDSAMDQYIVACTFEGTFTLTKQVVILMCVVGGMLFIMGIGLDGVAHIVPTTEIHWGP
jgi:hypothetical protein